MKLFKSDPALFLSYHQGYQHQAAQWPLDPLNCLMTEILRQDSGLVQDEVLGVGLSFGHAAWHSASVW